MAQNSEPQRPTVESDLDVTGKYLMWLRDSGKSVPIREFIGYWGARQRGSRIVSAIGRNLAELKLRTEPPFASGPIDGSVRIEDADDGDSRDQSVDLIDDHLLPVSRIPSAAFAIANVEEGKLVPGVVTRDWPVGSAATIMLREAYSQLAVVDELESMAIVGAFSWESYSRAVLRGVKPVAVSEAMAPAVTIDFNSDLFNVVRTVSDAGYALVSRRGRLAGIVTTSDLTDEFQELSVPFLAVGRCEQELKRVAHAKLDHVKNAEKIDQMMFGQLQQFYNSNWEDLEWGLDKAVFDDWMNATRRLRNSIAHFGDPDDDQSANVAAVHRLTDWLRYVMPGAGDDSAGGAEEKSFSR